MAIQFGVASTASYGLVQELSNAQTAEIAEARNETGKATNQVAFSKETVVRQRVITTDTLPVVGTTNALTTTVGLVRSVTQTENNTAYKTGEIEVAVKDSATVTAYA